MQRRRCIASRGRCGPVRAKALGRNQLSVFSPELLDAAASRFSTEQGLGTQSKAASSNWLSTGGRPAYFPGPACRGAAALAAAGRKTCFAADFLAIAEESGRIMEISDWVLRSSSVPQLSGIAAAGTTCGLLSTFSPQLLDAGFVNRVKNCFDSNRLPAKCIEIELTENVLQTGAELSKRCGNCAHAGSIALDDFGTGYSLWRP